MAAGGRINRTEPQKKKWPWIMGVVRGHHRPLEETRGLVAPVITEFRFRHSARSSQPPKVPALHNRAGNQHLEAMGFNRRKMEDQRRQIEKEAPRQPRD